jgi:NAD+ diphosphatase
MIQDLGRHIYHNEYKPVPADENGLVLIYRNREILLRDDPEGDGRILYPTFRELEEGLTDHSSQKIEELYKKATYLFTIDDCHYYLVPDVDAAACLKEYQFQDISRVRGAKPQYRAFAGVTGLQLHNWYTSRRFCGRCGTPMIHSQKERMMECPKCGLMEYPKICPAVIVGVRNKDRLLVSKYAGRGYKNYALIAGFNEIGETIEETVHREVMEEVGLKVKNLQFYKSQPWSFSDTLLMGFWCEVDGEDDITLDENELSMAAFVTRDELPAETDISLTREMMHQFKYGLV